MEALAVIDNAEIEVALEQVDIASLRELTSLELGLVGGGQASVSLI